MSDNNSEQESRETVADIVAQMRYGTIPKHRTDHELLALYADRLEAAWKRDEERAVEHATRHAEAVARDNCRDCVHNPRGKNYEGGNAAAIREALENAYSLLCEGIATEVDDELEHPFHLELACEKIQAALSEPLRNCDIGTPEEQSRRFDAYCHRRKCECLKCPCNVLPRCCLVWAQMPYRAEAEGGAK